MSIRIEDKSLRNTLNQLHKYSKAVKRKVGNQVQKSANNIELGAKSNCPVLTVNLRSSIHSTVKKDQLYASIGTNVRYAPYVEFGTGQLVSIPEGLESYAAKFKGKGIRQVNRQAKPFLFPATEAERKNFINGIKVILNERPN